MIRECFQLPAKGSGTCCISNLKTKRVKKFRTLETDGEVISYKPEIVCHWNCCMTSSEFVTSICEIFSRAEFLIIRHFKKWFPCPDEVIVYLHITFGGVKALIKWFWGHPLHRKLFGLPWAVYIFIYLSHQPKVCHFDLVAMANEDITGSKVSVNKPVFREMILLKIEEIYGKIV